MYRPQTAFPSHLVGVQSKTNKINLSKRVWWAPTQKQTRATKRAEVDKICRNLF